MGICRIEEVHYGVEDVAECVSFFDDFGLIRAPGTDGDDDTPTTATYLTPVGQRIRFSGRQDPRLPPALEPGSSVREMIWGVDSEADLARLGDAVAADREVIADADGSVHFTDESGFGVGLCVARRDPAQIAYRGTNATGHEGRVNAPLARLGRAHPFRACHVALFIASDGWQRAVAFYSDRLGFRITDQLLDMGTFMQAENDFDQHTLLLGHRADRTGINHLAFEVANFDEVVEGGNHMVARGWKEARRLGRHTIGSNVFRFFMAPCGGRVEYAADMDRVDADYGPNIYEERPPHHMWMLTTNGQKEEL